MLRMLCFEEAVNIPGIEKWGALVHSDIVLAYLEGRERLF